MYIVSRKKLEKVYAALLAVNYEFDPDNFTVEKLLEAVKDTNRYATVDQFFNGCNDFFINNTFKQISEMIYKAQTSDGIEFEEFAILNKISEHAIVALREHDRDWLKRIRQVVSNGMKQFKIQIAKRKENDFGATV